MNREIISALLDLRTWQAFDIDEDGRVLAGHDELGTVQLVEIAVDGIRTPLTRLPGRCRGRYVPGRRQVVVEHDHGGDEKMQLSLLELDGPAGDLPAGLDGLTAWVADPAFMHVLGDVDRERLVFSTNRRNGVDMDVVVRDWDAGPDVERDERVLYDGGGYVADLAASHDGRTVAVTMLSLQPNSTQILLAGAGGRPIAITDLDDHAMHVPAGWTAGDDALVLCSNHDRDFTAVYRVPVDSGRDQALPTGADWTELVADDKHDLSAWVAPDGAAMVVGTLDDGALGLAVHELDGRHRCSVELPRAGAVEVVWAADGSRFVVTLSSPTVPGSLLSVDAATGAATMIDGAEQIPAEVRPGVVEPSRHRIPASDGEQIPCFVFSPADSAATGGSVLLVHGGPEGASTRVFNPTVQALVACGLTVLVPNVRGSTGYGKRWYSLDDVELRLDSVADLAALHRWLPSIGLDPDRSALWGGSYGGYMVLAGVTMQPDLWAAGVDIVGISSLVTFLENTSGYRRAYREREYGTLAAHRELLEAASPVTFLDQLRAPLFVIHGANDPRVPLSEAEQIVAALAERGIDHEFRVYADEGHGLAKRVNRLDAYPAAISFLLEQLRAR